VNITVADFMRSLSNELSTPNLLWCPADRARTAASQFEGLTNENISYFANPQARAGRATDFLFGDRNLRTNGFPVPSGASLKLTPDLDLGWTNDLHDEQGNIAMNDGSVQQFASERLRAAMKSIEQPGHVLLIP
jgi:prepilin-type processing-associated H-X9-DG protein